MAIVFLKQTDVLLSRELSKRGKRHFQVEEEIDITS